MRRSGPSIGRKLLRESRTPSVPRACLVRVRYAWSGCAAPGPIPANSRSSSYPRVLADHAGHRSVRGTASARPRVHHHGHGPLPAPAPRAAALRRRTHPAGAATQMRGARRFAAERRNPGDAAVTRDRSGVFTGKRDRNGHGRRRPATSLSDESVPRHSNEANQASSHVSS